MREERREKREERRATRRERREKREARRATRRERREKREERRETREDIMYTRYVSILCRVFYMIEYKYLVHDSCFFL